MPVATNASSSFDDGSEFVPRDLDPPTYKQGVVQDSSRPGKPTNNAYIESFNEGSGPSA